MLNHIYILLELYPNKSWNYYYLSQNPNITWDIVQNNLSKLWNYEYLSQNPNITWDIVKANPDKPWSYYILSKNPNITWDIVKSNPELNRPYKLLSKHPNLTWKIIRDNPDISWDYYYLSRNQFNKDNHLTKKRLMQKYFDIWLIKNRAIRKIKNHWMTEFSASMDILKLRKRDREMGIV